MSRKFELSREQQREYDREMAARRAANATPAPGPLAQGLAPEDIEVCGLRLRPFTGADWVTLQRMESPFLEAVINGKPPQLSFEQVYELAYVFTIPAPEARRQLARGREIFRETAMVAVADRMPADGIGRLQEALVEVVMRALGTRIEHEPKSKDGEVFTKAQEAPATASAGS